ncbi:transglutaminase domain-containing protein, partial [Endothiovibrio diazotrophicus]
DAELTLSARRGNAMDIASLTLALLRASGIPARYVHGTMDVPVDKYRNWMGGFSNVMAAADYASSGGIPTRVLSEGGQPAWVRMEHVWVEAALDFHPGRAYRNLEADSWIALDPSFKQYEYLEGIDVAQIAGL